MAVDASFARALPKVELHAHLTGSISSECLHEIWTRKQSTLKDPLSVLRPDGAYHDIFTFFKLFDTYIYGLCNDVETVAYATKRVLQDFQNDGVRYLELRTTPRESSETGMTKEVYVQTVLKAIKEHDAITMPTYLILSVDRRNTVSQAMAVVDLATKIPDRGVIGIDLCGNPLKGDVTTFKDVFARARANGLKVTLHFAEVPESSTEQELRTLLSYRPDRLGHVIHTSPEIDAMIERQACGLELCLSCNVHAKMLPSAGRFADHHFGRWHSRPNAIALCTDDVGVFGSTVSNEYLLAAEHFSLNRKDLIALSRCAVPSIFGSEEEKQRLMTLLNDFERSIVG
ncbi:Adenosine deaminase-like protein [Pseudocercospora fuligena]|uniref:Adenosine deaminase-like protein n=1 Tax=Pseudocercospora fuligena TaxID=685502 RepID=A0A8H6RRP2_9PEZI|nr:Adenosine deaminase-like protein [Pseudocercospora fuligena]